MAAQTVSEGLQSPDAHREPVQKRPKRSYVACYRCHSQKVKCSGETPCRRCRGTDSPDKCEYPARDRRITVTESYLKKLEAENRNGKRARDSHSDEQGQSPKTPVDAESLLYSQTNQLEQSVEGSVTETQKLQHLDHDLRQQFIGQSTSAAFGSRLLQCLQPQATLISAPDLHFLKDPSFARQKTTSAEFQLPGRISANLLIRTALRFIGQDYHFLLRHEFLQQLEQAYSLAREGHQCDSIWACKFFAVLALGELYAGSSVVANSHEVPGSDYFMKANALLQDQYEEPTLAQIEIMLLFYFYSHALGRVRSAHIYSCLAVRYSIALDLHRKQSANSSSTSIRREHEVRLWWTCYVFERSSCSRLGQPLTVQDADIDVELPSMEQLSPEDQKKFCSPAHLIANIELAKIEGNIMCDIYGISSSIRGSFVHNIRKILNKLRQWDSSVPPSLRLSQGASNRPLASLQLHFNECIILTTRPVLLHVLKAKNPFVTCGDADSIASPLSDTAMTLAESCLSAARTTNSILSQLYVENALAIFGYFDAHYLFSSTLVLIVSALISPSSNDSDAVQTAFHLLKLMCDRGSLPALQYYTRLAHIQRSIGAFRSQTTGNQSGDNQDNAIVARDSPQASQNMHPIPDNQFDTDSFDWTKILVSNSTAEEYDWVGMGHAAVDPLDNPVLLTFLDHAGLDKSLDLGVDDLTSYL